MTSLIFRFTLCLLVFNLTVEIAPCMAQNKSSSQTDYTINLPSGWVEIPKDVIDSAAQELRRASKLTNINKYDHAYQMEGGSKWFDYPYILVEVKKIGKATQQDLDKLEQADPSSESDKVKKTFGSFLSSMEIGKMQYDKKSHIIWFKARSDVNDIGTIESLNGIILTSEGCIQIGGYARQKDFAARADVFRNIIEKVTLSDRLKYQESSLIEGTFLSRMNWGQLLSRALVGGLIGGCIAVFFALFRKFSGN